MKNSTAVLSKMEQYLDQWKSCNDSRLIFLNCYYLMSSNMVQAINNNEFHDTVWVNKLLCRFADYYFENLACYDCGEAPSKIWEYTHKLTCENKLSHIQALILGVNAHINYDLVLALHDVLRPEWDELSEETKKIRYLDHSQVNRVIANTIDQVQDEVLEPLDPKLKWVDALLGRLDEYLISRLVTNWREDVWRNTQELMKFKEGHHYEIFRLQLETQALKKANTISIF